MNVIDIDPIDIKTTYPTDVLKIERPIDFSKLVDRSVEEVAAGVYSDHARIQTRVTYGIDKNGETTRLFSEVTI